MDRVGTDSSRPKRRFSHDVYTKRACVWYTTILRTSIRAKERIRTFRSCSN